MARQKKPKKDRADQKYALVDGTTMEGAHVLDLVKAGMEYPEHAAHKENKTRVAAAWMLGLKPNKDGQVTKAKVKICTELERIQKPVDVIVLLNQEWWRSTDDKERLAILDDKLCRVDVVEGHGGIGVALNGHGMVRYRKRAPDMIAFRSVLARHGSYEPDIRKCVDSALEADTQLALPGTGTVDRKLRLAGS